MTLQQTIAECYLYGIELSREIPIQPRNQISSTFTEPKERTFVSTQATRPLLKARLVANTDPFNKGYSLNLK